MCSGAIPSSGAFAKSLRTPRVRRREIGLKWQFGAYPEVVPGEGPLARLGLAAVVRNRETGELVRYEIWLDMD